MNITELYNNYIAKHNVTIDTRKINIGDVYIALRGTNFDGNKFAIQALNTGASIAIVDDPSLADKNRCVYVENCLTFLQEVAAYHRHVLNIPIIGITGTNGKTTTKELCNCVLSKKFTTYATQGNLNNHIGVPLTLLAMTRKTQIGIVEMGANHPDEIRELCKISDPDFGIITNIGHAHLEGFGCYENIIKTKKQLYDHIAAKNGKLFVNANDELLMSLSENTKRHTYGTNGDCEKGELKQSIPSLVFALRSMKGDLYVKTHLIGGYNFDNAMAAAAIGHYFGIDDLTIRDAIESYQPTNMRSQLIKSEQNTIILDAYNANPSSMTVALKNFMEFNAPHKKVILGEMRELGSESEKAHADIIELIIEGHFEEALLVGSHFENINKTHNFIQHFADTDALKKYLKANPISDSCILVKGSRGNQLEQIVELL